MNLVSPCCTATMIACSLIVTVHAADEDATYDTRFVIGDLEEVVVTARSVPPANIPGSVDVLGRSQLANEHVNLTMDLFKKVPGVTFSRYNQGIVSMDIAFRGFNAEGESPSFKLLIDGIPSNLHTGLSEMDALFPMELERIEVVKGPNDPRYGLLNAAGNINMFTRRDQALEVEALAGSFDTYELQGYYGGEAGKLSQHYFVGHRESDGYRDNSALEKTTVGGRWFYQATDRLNVGLIARWFDFSADAPGYLTLADAHSHPTLSYPFSATDGGDKQTRHTSLHVDYAFSDLLILQVKGYQQHFERNRFVRFTGAGLQQERVEDEDQSGVIATMSWQPRAGTLLNWGVDYQAQDNINQRFRTVERVRTGLVLRDQAFDYNVYGGFVQWQQDVNDKLQFVAGLRLDRFTGDFTNVMSGATADINDYGTIVQPKLGLVYSLNDYVALFANGGRSFQAGVGAGAYPAPGKDVDASRNDGGEVGVHLRAGERFNARFALWRQTASDELVLKYDNSGDLENVGSTTRDGWELSLGWRPLQQWYLWGSYSAQRALLTNPGALSSAIRGNTLHHTPDYTASLGLEYQVTKALKATLFTNWQDDYYLDNTNATGRFGGYALSDLTLNYAFKKVNLSMRVNNLFDRYYEYVWHDGSTSLHAAGTERSYDVSVAFKF